MRRPGPTNSISDVAGLMVGHAQDAVLKSGVTVLTAEHPFRASVAVMGGAPGTRETDLLAPDKSVMEVDAIVLSGGSAFGLDACGGVAAGLRARGRGYRVGRVRVPIVPGAILFDLLSGGAQDWMENPYPALGRAALDHAGSEVAQGSLGAGTGALTATLKGGIGTASLVLTTGHTVAALAAANAAGSVTTPGQRHFWAAPYEIGAEFGGLGPDPRAELGRSWVGKPNGGMQEGTNTTIAIVATDAHLEKAQCQRLAWAAHAGIARACLPSHTASDGDLVFAVSHGARPLDEPGDLSMIGHGAALCLSRAIARAVYHASVASGDILPCWSSLNRTARR